MNQKYPLSSKRGYIVFHKTLKEVETTDNNNSKIKASVVINPVQHFHYIKTEEDYLNIMQQCWSYKVSFLIAWYHNTSTIEK